MAAGDRPAGVYTEDEYVSVVDEATGVVTDHKVPRSWLGTDLGVGLKAATKAQAEKA